RVRRERRTITEEEVAKGEAGTIVRRSDTPTYTQAGTPWPEPRDQHPGGTPVAESVTRPCDLCGAPMPSWQRFEDGGLDFGHNARPLGGPGARCCERCNVEKVIPARLGVEGQRTGGERMALASSAHQGELPGAKHPGARLDDPLPPVASGKTTGAAAEQVGAVAQ